MTSAVYTLPSYCSHYEIDSTGRIQVLKSLTHQPPKGGTPGWVTVALGRLFLIKFIYLLPLFKKRRRKEKKRKKDWLSS